MEYFSEPFQISLLKNHILKDPIIDWFNIQSSINNKYKKDNNSYYKDYIIKESNEYKINLLQKIKKHSKKNIPNNPTTQETIQLLKKNHPIILLGKLPFKNMIVNCDIIIKLNQFFTIFPKIKNIPFHLLCKKNDYLLINLSYSSINFKMDLKESQNDGVLLYKKCCIYAFQLAINEIINYKPFSFILGKDYYYKKTLLPKKEFISLIHFDDKIKQKYSNAYQWILKLKKEYKSMDIQPIPTHNELYPNMNYKESSWENEKYKLAEKIKEITLVWNISYENRCDYLKKNIKCWDDPMLLKHLKESKKKDIQERMIHMNQQDDILIYPRKNISPEFSTLLTQTNNDIFFDVESFLSFDQKQGLSTDITYIEEPILAILGFIHNNKFLDFTIQDFSKKEEEIIISNFCKYLWNINNNKELINIYHWGHAEYNYFQYIHKTYPTIIFPNYKLINVLDYFRMEPIIVQGVFKFGLKSIGKALYKNKLIQTTWDDENDNGLDAMIQFKEICIKHTKNIPLKRYIQISNIIHYNNIDCQVLFEIVNLLRKKYKSSKP